MIKINYREYKTKPVDCWELGKECRRGHFWHIWDAHDKGEILVMGTLQAEMALPAGFGDYAFTNFSPYFTRMLHNPDIAVKAFEAFDSKGYGNDICAPMALQLGQLFQGLSTCSPHGKVVKPDFILETYWCPHTAKAGLIASEELGIPFIVLDFPYKDDPHCIDYVVSQLNEAIERIETVTGRIYDDEKLIEATQNEWRSMSLWAKIVELQKAIPAPLSMSQLTTLGMPLASTRHQKRCSKYLETLLHETEERVRDQISATGTERARLLMIGGEPMGDFSIMREPEKYGAVVIGGPIDPMTFGAWEILKDGTYQIAKTPEERGWKLRTREDALRAIAEVLNTGQPNRRYDLSSQGQELIKVVEDWHVDAVIFCYMHGCPDRLSAGWPQVRLELKEKGIPTVACEVHQCDPRGWDKPRVLDRVDSFCEFLGLTRLNI